MGSEQESNEFSAFLEEAKTYDGFEYEDSDESTGEDQDVQDAGEESEGTDEDQDTEDAAGTEDDGQSFEVTLPGGQKVQVPLSELVAGYSRQQDYTRKTQALAAERRNLADAAAIAQALERNPAAAIDALARAYGLNGTQQDEDEYLSDEDRWRREVDARFQAQDRMQREAALNSEISRLHSVYGDFDEEALFRHALDTNTVNLEIALQAMSFQTMRAQQATRTQRSTEMRNGKKAASAAPPASRNGKGSVPVVEDGEVRTFRDAYEYAKRVQNRS